MRILGVCFMFLFLLSITFTACESENEELPTSQTIAEEESFVTDLLSAIDLIIEVNAGAEQESELLEPAIQKSVDVAEYPRVTIDFPELGKLWPRIITIDFGSQNFELSIGNETNGNNRELLLKGKIVVVKMRPQYEAGAQRNVSFVGFHVNNARIDGETSFSNEGLNESNNWVFGCFVDVKIILADGTWITRNASKESELIAGDLTPLFVWDDAYIVNGFAIGSNSNGWAYTVDQQNIEVKRSCRFPVKGTAVVENNIVSYSVNFGNGDCDNNAIITDSNGNSFNIVLGRN